MTQLAYAQTPLFSSSETTVKPISHLDPYEGWNRQAHDFNMVFIDKVGKPVAEAYTDYVPSPVQTGIKNFVYNLKMPLNIINAFLQGKGQKGFEGIMRLSINTVFGLGGILDIATPAGLAYESKDFGQTLFVWGLWEEANYLVIPFLGPYTTRELAGTGTEILFDPTYDHIVNATDNQRLASSFTDQFVSFTSYVDLVETMKSQPDAYLFLRESYLQYRNNQLYDGQAPQPELDDFDFE